MAPTRIVLNLTIAEAEALHFLAWSTAEQPDIYESVLTSVQQRRAGDRALNKLNREIAQTWKS